MYRLFTYNGDTKKREQATGKTKCANMGYELALIWSLAERDRIEAYRKFIRDDHGSGAIWTGEKCISRTNGKDGTTRGDGPAGNGVWTSDYVKDDNSLWLGGTNPAQKCESGEHGECLAINWNGDEIGWNDEVCTKDLYILCSLPLCKRK
jgi:hypothetical protein